MQKGCIVLLTSACIRAWLHLHLTYNSWKLPTQKIDMPIHGVRTEKWSSISADKIYLCQFLFKLSGVRPRTKALYILVRVSRSFELTIFEISCLILFLHFAQTSISSKFRWRKKIIMTRVPTPCAFLLVTAVTNSG